MTALPDTPGTSTLVVRGPDSLPVVVPHLLGFHPERSVVLLGLDDGHAVRVTMRVDLVDAATDDGGWADLVPVLRRAGASCALIVVYPEHDPWSGGEPLPHRPVVDAARHALRDADVHVLDALCVAGHRLASYWCCDTACCPPGGRVADCSELLRVDAELVGAGSAPLRSREVLVSVLEPRPDDDPLVREVADELDLLAGDVATYGQHDIDSFLVGVAVHASRPQEPHLLPALVALATSLCWWVRPRDLLLRALSVDADPAQLRAARGVLVEAVRCARVGDVAPVASLLAVCAWLTGDGAQARVALDRAQQADPGYSLAALLSAALDDGVPPWTWSSMMADLPVERILETGDGPPRRHGPDDGLLGSLPDGDGRGQAPTGRL